MRLKEPFRGLYLVGGLSVFHFTLLVVSIIVLGFPTEITDKNQEHNQSVNFLRAAHALDTFFVIIQFLGSSPYAYIKHVFTFRIMDAIKMFAYLAAIMFAIYHECHTAKSTLNDPDFWIRHAEVWIRLELVVFFVQILCSTVFLMGIQIRGERGHNNDPNFQRYKTDCLRYYENDIAWFSYVAVCICMHIWFQFKYLQKPSQDDQSKKTIYSCYMILVNLLRLILLMPYRNSNRTYTKISKNKWMAMFVLEIIGAAYFLTFKRIKGSNTFASCLIDASCLVSMLVIYKYNQTKEQPPKDEEVPMVHIQSVSDVEQTQQCLRENKRVRSLKIDNSIYNLALFTLIDQKVVEEWQQQVVPNLKGPNKLTPAIQMSEKEKDGIFFGLSTVVGLQIITTALIAIEFIGNIEQIQVKSFWILVPRVIASFYMHSTLAAEIQNGLDTMKYVVNHPEHFLKRTLDEDDDEGTSKEDGHYIRYTYAFLIGFIQYILTIALEMMTIVFLNSLDSYLFILLCYAALSGVASFDNMYASALSKTNSIRGAVDKQLFISFHRYMKHEFPEEDPSQFKGQYDLNCQSQNVRADPLEGKLFFTIFRYIYKFWRIVHVSFYFYFAPFLMLIYQFFLNKSPVE